MSQRGRNYKPCERGGMRFSTGRITAGFYWIPIESRGIHDICDLVVEIMRYFTGFRQE